MGLGAQRSCCCGRRIDIYFCIAMADGVYLTIFLLGYVCEAPERRQIKSIYLHSAFLQAVDFLNLRGPDSRDWGRWEKNVAGVGARDPRVEITPQASVTGTRSRPRCPGPLPASPSESTPCAERSCLLALCPVAGVRDGARPPARRRSAPGGRREHSLVRLTSQGGRVRVIVPH